LAVCGKSERETRGNWQAVLLQEMERINGSEFRSYFLLVRLVQVG